MMPENEVWVNADVARRLGLRAASYVRLRNQDGVREQPDPGQGDRAHPRRLRLHGARLRPHARGADRAALGKGASDAQLITRYAVDPLMGGTGMNVNFVTLEAEA